MTEADVIGRIAKALGERFAFAEGLGDDTDMARVAWQEMKAIALADMPRKHDCIDAREIIGQSVGEGARMAHRWPTGMIK